VKKSDNAPGEAGAYRLGTTGDVVSDSTVSVSDYTTVLPQIPCPRCAFPGPHRPGPGAGPHHARLVCGECQRFLKWIAKPRQQEVQP
jgi:hypothetical protein